MAVMALQGGQVIWANQGIGWPDGGQRGTMGALIREATRSQGDTLGANGGPDGGRDGGPDGRRDCEANGRRDSGADGGRDPWADRVENCEAVLLAWKLFFTFLQQGFSEISSFLM